MTAIETPTPVTGMPRIGDPAPSFTASTTQGDISFPSDYVGKWVILFWTLYNLVVLSVTLVACVELPRRERHVADAPERVRVSFGGEQMDLWMTNLTLDHARLRGRQFEIGTRGTIELENVGAVATYVSAKSRDGVRLQLLPDDTQRAALLLRFYTEDNTPGISNVRMSAMLRDVARRFTFSSNTKGRG